MTPDISPERQRQIDELLGARVVDADPERQVLACRDCLTPTLATYGLILSIAHDPTCPTFRAMPVADRVQVNEESGATVVHVSIGPPSSCSGDGA